VVFYLGSGDLIASWLIIRGEHDPGDRCGGAVILIVAALFAALRAAMVRTSPRG
jgi:hypothetical protein